MNIETGEIVRFKTDEERDAFLSAKRHEAYVQIDPEFLTEKEAMEGVVKDDEIRSLVAMLSNAENMTRQQKRKLLKKLKKARKRVEG